MHRLTDAMHMAGRMYIHCAYKNSWNRKQNNVCVTLDSELAVSECVVS